MAEPAPLPPEHWYFEWLSSDGKRALLRRLDASSRSTFHARVVDVETGKTVSEENLEELSKVPFETIGHNAFELAKLEAVLDAPMLGEDLVRGARMVGTFPLGSSGRISAAKDGGAIAFNAGDWLYVADKSGRVQKRLSDEASYDPRFTPDGKNLLFRRLTAAVAPGFAKYELFVVPSDLSTAPKRLEGTAGARDRFAVSADGSTAVTISSHEPQIKTCVLSVGLRAPFGVKRLSCLDGGEQLVESVLSPKGRWAAITTQKRVEDAGSGRRLTWRLRVIALATGKVVVDEPQAAGLGIRAISDTGLLVQSGLRGVALHDVPGKKRRTLAREIDLGYRGFFRGPSELVFVQGRDVSVVDLAKEQAAGT